MLAELIDQYGADAIAAAVSQDPTLRSWTLAREGTRWGSFVPRPDSPENFDQQSSFVFNRDSVAFLVAGNASGKSAAAAYKTARFLLVDQPPPRKDTPFWIIGPNYDLSISMCWGEKLHGEQYLPDCEVDWDRVTYLSRKEDYPSSVPLRPWPSYRGGHPGKNWKIEFKSVEQGRQALQARSIGGFWFTEQFPWPIFEETLRGCRDYMFPGGQFAEFTPIEPELCLGLEKLMDKPPPGWRFYQCNTECNTTLAKGWAEQFFATVAEEMIMTRKIGALATFKGVIFETFNPLVHVVDEEELLFPLGAWHYRGIDWGASSQHPFVCIWAYRDGIGDWWVYDEYWCAQQGITTAEHAHEILDRWPDIWQPGPHNKGETFADPSRPDCFTNCAAEGLVIFPGSNDVFAGIDTVRSLLKINPFTQRPRLRISRRCVHLIEEIRKYRWKEARNAMGALKLSDLPKPSPLKKDDDCCDALRYILYSVEKQKGAPPSSIRNPGQDSQRKSVQLAIGQAAQRRRDQLAKLTRR